jgi:hypothetical protein
MSDGTPNIVLKAAWRAMPATDRWQLFQAQLSRASTTTDSYPWTRRSVVTCGWRAFPAGVSATCPATL